MKKIYSSRGRRILSAICAIFLAVFSAAAQTDPNPDSPTPILISEPDSLRALATDGLITKGGATQIKNAAFAPGSKVLLYVTNLDLMTGEGANAFRVNVEDALGRQYRFPVLDIQPLKNQEWIYALTIELRDTLGFYTQSVTEGDVLISVAWRGLASNRLRLGFGATGGTIRDDGAAKPVPFPNAPVKNSIKQESINARVGYLYSGDRIRFLEQATFGPTQALDDRIRRIGLRVWLEEQFNAPYPTNPYPSFPLMPGNPTAECQAGTPVNCIRDHYSMYPVQNWFFKEAFYGEAQLKHRVSWALSQLWVISGVDTQQSSHMIAYHQLLSKNAFGNYRTLMNDITLNPGMGNYLDMARSTRNNPNENFAREILQLFSVGLFMMNQDGTLMLDSQGNPIPTYDQETVNNFTKVLTGFSFCNTPGTCPNVTVGTNNYKDPMILNQNNHNIEAKTLLDYCGIGIQCSTPTINKNIAPNLNGNTEMQMALDNIFNHPNVAPFVSRILIQNMVTSDPSPFYVGQVAAVFNNNGMNVRGDMKAVIRAILLHPEARGNVKTDANYGKLREPVQFAANILRQFGVRSANPGTSPSDGYINPQMNNMGQNVFNAPTVFNYYSPEYVVPGPGLNGPEFGIQTTGTSVARVNFINTMVYSQIAVNQPNAPLGTSINLAEMQALAAEDATGNRLLDVLNTRLMHGTMTAQNRATILSAVTALPATNTLGRAQAAIYSIATSSQYQIQR